MSFASTPFVSPSAAAAGEDGCYVLRVSGKAWQVTTELRTQLLATGGWTLARREDQPAHLLLADRGRVQWARELVARRAPAIPKRFERYLNRTAQAHAAAGLAMVNAYRGCNDLSNKSAMVKTMRLYAAERGISTTQLEYLPLTFVLRPGDPSDERQQFLEEFYRQQQSAASAESHSAAAASAAATPASSGHNVWIVKANRGAKGNDIFVSDNVAKLIAYVDSRTGDASADAAAFAAISAKIPDDTAVSPASSNGSNVPLSARAPPLRSHRRVGTMAGPSSVSVVGPASARAVAGQHRSTLSSSSMKSLTAAASNSWVVQRYVSRPFLFAGGRKFDIRSWALLDSRYQPYLYRQSVCRTSSTPYDASNLADRFAHLTNHCIQTEHPDFGKAAGNAARKGGEDGAGDDFDEVENEVFLPGFQRYLDSLPLPEAGSPSPLPPHRLCVICHLLPQLRHVVAETLGAVRARMESSGDFLCWQLFGFDFMLDDRFHVRLLEINATPASAMPLLTNLVRHLRERAIETVFPTEPPRSASAAAAASRGSAQAVAVAADAGGAMPTAAFAVPSTPRGGGSGGGGGGFSSAAVLARPCQCATTLRGLSKEAFLAPKDHSVNLFDPL